MCNTSHRTYIVMIVSLSVIQQKVDLSILIFKSCNPTGMTTDEKNTHFIPLEF